VDEKSSSSNFVIKYRYGWLSLLDLVYLFSKGTTSLEKILFYNKINNQLKFGREEPNKIREIGDLMLFINQLFKEAERKLFLKHSEVYY
jgi:hypothetical protein